MISIPYPPQAASVIDRAETCYVCVYNSPLPNRSSAAHLVQSGVVHVALNLAVPPTNAGSEYEGVIKRMGSQ